MCFDVESRPNRKTSWSAQETKTLENMRAISSPEVAVTCSSKREQIQGSRCINHTIFIFIIMLTKDKDKDISRLIPKVSTKNILWLRFVSWDQNHTNWDQSQESCRQIKNLHHLPSCPVCLIRCIQNHQRIAAPKLVTDRFFTGNTGVPFFRSNPHLSPIPSFFSWYFGFLSCMQLLG